MPHPSWSAVERGNPPPRRKSCAACIKAKRRCSQDSPACARCVQRGIECKYPESMESRRRHVRDLPVREPVRPATATQLEASQPASQGLTFQVPLAAVWDPSMFSPFIDTNLLLDPFSEHTDPPGSEGHTLVDTLVLSGADLTAGSSESSITLTGYSDHHAPRSSGESSTVKTNADGLTLLEGANSAVSLPYVGDGLPGDIVSFVIQARLRYAIDKMSTSPRQMVLEGRTPWCHPQVYHRAMPRHMEDALSSCALFVAKNDANAHLISRTIESRAQELITSPVPSEPLDILARAHALLLYQAMRLWGGVLHLRTSIEAGMSALEEVGLSLMRFTTFEGGTFEEYGCDTPLLAPSLDTDQAYQSNDSGIIRAFWENWVFQESARRTFLIIALFIRTYRLLKGNLTVVGEEEECDGKLHLCHSFTMSSHLWEAEDFIDFSVAWRTKRHFIIKNADFRSALAEANADDVDTYSKIFICTIMGMDETKLWLTSRGGSL